MKKSANKEVLKALKGVFEMKLYGPDNVLKDYRLVKNLTVNSGYSRVCEQMGYTGAQPAAFGFTAVGTDGTGPTTNDVALGSQLEDRHTAGYSSVSVLSWSNNATFAAGHATGAIRESGLFNDVSAGFMLCRQTFAVINKGASDTLVVTWTYTLS